MAPVLLSLAPSETQRHLFVLFGIELVSQCKMVNPEKGFHVSIRVTGPGTGATTGDHQFGWALV